MSTPDAEKPKLLVGHVQGDPANLPPGILYVPGRDPDAPSRISKEIEVSDDPALLAWTRQAYEADLDQRFTIALQRVQRGEKVYLEYRDALKERSDQAGEELRRIMGDEQASAKARARAAEVLAGIGQTDGSAFLLAALESAAPELSAAALEMLSDWNNKIDLTRPEVAARIIQSLSSPEPEVAAKAAHLCTWRNVPGAEDGLRTALMNHPQPSPQMAEALARLATTAESVWAALPDLFQRRPKKYTFSISYNYRRVLDHPDAAVSRPLRQALLRYLLTFTDDGDRLGQHWACDIAAAADETVLPILEDIIARAKDPVSRSYALGGIARLRPEQAVERVLEQIRRDRPWSMLVRLLRKYAVEADYERVCAVLYPDAEGGNKRRLEMDDARLLLENLGQRGRQRLIQEMNRLEEHAREWAVWKLQGLDVRNALGELQAAGVIRQTPEELLARMSARSEEPLDMTNPSLFTRALGYAKLTTGFDTETGFVPCNHHYLIQEFADGSDGRFAPECPIQIWHRKSAKDYDSPYLVQFIYHGRLYRFAAENYGDYYDVESVVRALNTALEQNGRRERYIGLYTGDQCAHFVFADPTAFGPIAQKYGLPLSQDASEGMRAGRAYEQYVSEQLKK
jgi:hypothetical protein